MRIIEPNSFIWEKQKKRIHEQQGQVITITPCSTFNQVIKTEKVSGFNLIDVVTQRHYNSKGFLFVNQIPTIFTAEIFMNDNWILSIIHGGDEVGIVKLYPNTRRLVQSVEYLNQDGTIDFIEEYADDWTLFSNIFFHENKAERIDFVSSNQLPQLGSMKGNRLTISGGMFFVLGVMYAAKIRNKKSN